MSTIQVTAAAATASAAYDSRSELQAFDDTNAIPAIFHHPPHSLQDITRPPSSSTDGDVAIPVVDLSAARREEVLGQVKAAAETVGFFQVTNHGVPGEVMAGMLAAVRRFNEEPAEAKRPYYTRDSARKVRFSSNFDLFQSPAANWRDTLFCELAPEPLPPEELPEALRPVMVEYGEAARGLALRVLELLSESLGLAGDHLSEMGCVDSVQSVCQYYPPCPEPHLTLGTSRHTDPSFLTVLLQDGMGGLQMLHDRGGGRRGWVDVPPVPGALIINIGDLLQLVSNGRFRSVEHRVLANRSRDTPRVSVACFCNADMKTSTRLYGPVAKRVSPGGGGGGVDDEPPLYRTITVQEYLAQYYKKGLDGRHALDYFRLEQHTTDPDLDHDDQGA